MTRLSYQDILKERKPIDFVIGPSIYFLFDGDEIVYIGRSRNVMKRISAHLNDKYFDSYAVFWVGKSRSVEIEAAMIGLYRPKYNTNIPLFLPDHQTVWMHTCCTPMSAPRNRSSEVKISTFSRKTRGWRSH